MIKRAEKPSAYIEVIPARLESQVNISRCGMPCLPLPEITYLSAVTERKNRASVLCLLPWC